MLECPTRNCGPKLQNRVACRRRKSSKRDPERWHGSCHIWHGPCQASDLGASYFCAQSCIFPAWISS